jgi:hypothetical protein
MRSGRSLIAVTWNGEVISFRRLWVPVVVVSALYGMEERRSAGLGCFQKSAVRICACVRVVECLNLTCLTFNDSMIR